MIQKATPVGNWWLGASSWHHASFMHRVSCRVLQWNIKSPRWLGHPTAQTWLPATSGFSQTKITFEKDKISDHEWASGKCDRAADSNWENCVKAQGAYFEGDWGRIIRRTIFLVFCIFFNKCLYFSCYMTGFLLDTPCSFTIFSLLSVFSIDCNPFEERNVYLFFLFLFSLLKLQHLEEYLLNEWRTGYKIIS